MGESNTLIEKLLCWNMEKPGKPLNNEAVLGLQVQPGPRKLQLFIPELAAASQPLGKSRDSSCFRCMVVQDAFIRDGCDVLCLWSSVPVQVTAEVVA